MAGYLIGVEHVGQGDWDKLKGWLEASRRRSGVGGPLVGPHDVLWVARQWPEAVGCCTAALSSDGRSIIVGDLGGQGTGWIAPLLDKLMDWAGCEGAVEVRALCRPGWRRILPALGCVPDGDWFVRSI